MISKKTAFSWLLFLHQSQTTKVVVYSAQLNIQVNTLTEICLKCNLTYPHLLVMCNTNKWGYVTANFMIL